MPVSPVPSTELVNRMRVALRDWVTKGIEPPDSVWPQLKGKKSERTLVEPTMQAMGFPHGIPGIPDSIFSPDNFVNPVLDYDWGPEFDEFNATGNPTNIPPPIKHVIKMLVPAVDSDGNELGGVPTVLRDAPLGTYLGWNITAAGFHKDKICNYAGGMIPFARTKADRMASGDPRLSLQERYVDHNGYVDAVRKAAANAVAQRFLLQEDADALIAQAAASTVLSP